MSFECAPVTKGLMISAGLSSFVVGLFDVKYYFHLQLVPHISRHHQYWRLLTQYLAFTDSSDLFLAELLLYNVGIHIERRFGSVKYASFLVMTVLLSALFEFLALLLFNPFGLNHIATGASVLVYSILYQYSRLVPAVYSFRLFGITLNNKSFNYFLAFQLAISRAPGSLVIALVGILTGQLYRSEIASFNTYRLPPSIISFSMRYLLPFVGSLRAPRRLTRAIPEDSRSMNIHSMDLGSGNEEVITTSRSLSQGSTPRLQNTDEPTIEHNNRNSVMREWMNELTGRTDRTNAGIRIPTEAEISQLMNMFPTLEREVVVGALQRSRNIEGAVVTLLSAHT